MKNILTICEEQDYMPTVTSVRDGTNDIIIRAVNPSMNPMAEIYVGGKFMTKLMLASSFGTKIPDEYCTKTNIHVRYIDDTTVSRFFHIIGNKKMRELKLVKRAECILDCEGVPEMKQAEDNAGAKTEIVSRLPKISEAKSGVIYFVTKKFDDEQDKYDEYMLINGEWERFTETQETQDIDFSKILE